MKNPPNAPSKDPSSKWSECFQTQLLLNLSDASLNTVTINDPFQKLKTLGRPDNRNPFKQGRFIYYKLGVEVRGVNNMIELFTFFMQDEMKKHKSCQVNLINESGSEILLYKNTFPKEIISILGNPENEEILRGNKVYHFRHKEVLLECSFNPQGLIGLEMESV